jgi:NhaA family Na+:H+ antiporter
MAKHKIQREVLPGIILIAAAVLAMLLSNSIFAERYFSFIQQQTPLNVLFLVNDILMVIFFLDVGLEIKHQVAVGHLSKIRQISLPAIAACGGVIIPALIYVCLNWSDTIALRGWAIPTATDIAFALGVIIILGKRVPLQLKVLLLAIAVFDDLIAILIIAIFYTPSISYIYLALSASIIIILCLMNYFNIKNIVHYLMVGSLLWFCMLYSGIHPTISGVIVALTIPLATRQTIHKQLYFWVSFVIMPLFALTNAGIPLHNLSIEQLSEKVPLGVALGLILGKQLGIFSFSWLAVKSKVAVLPKEITWSQYYGMAIICGIGFTMSIFIGNLAFNNISAEYMALNKAGVLFASSVSAVLGFLFLRLNSKPQRA